MKDPRIVEIEFLSLLDKERPSSVAPWDMEKTLNVSREFFRDMVFGLFREHCLEGTSNLLPPYDHHGGVSSEGVVINVGRQEIDRAIANVLRHETFSAHINHAGRVRLWRLRDEVLKIRTKEKFGILWDRRHWDTDVTMHLAMLDKEASSAVLFMDLDSFKPINDKLGHSIGDEVLQLFFQNVLRLVGDLGEAYGWGGDEVVALLRNVDQSRAEAIASGISDSVEMQCGNDARLTEIGAKVTVSVGVFAFVGRESPAEIADKADKLMYATKRKKKGL